jgi:low molecular weight protein-tyrosine phosphatase
VNSILDTGSPLVESADKARRGTLELLTTIARSIAERARLRVACEIARRGVARVRRDPTAVTQALRTATQVLVVCHGNIIRSAFAARLLQQRLGASHLRVVSAGVEAIPGRTAHPIALRIARRRCVDLDDHAASRVSAAAIRASDVVFAVDLIQFVALRERFPEARAKTFLLTSLAPSSPMEIADPVNGDDRAFEACFQHITQAVDAICRVVGPRTAIR